MDRIEEIFAERLLDTIRHKKMTQKELAKITGMTDSAISQYVHAVQCPHSTSLLLIADALNVSIDYLLGRTDRQRILK